MEAKNLVSIEKIRAMHELNETLNKETIDLDGYKKDYRLFKEYAEKIGATITGETLVLYLHHLLKEKAVMKNTFNRRYFACKKMLELEGIELTDDEVKMVKKLRSLYRTEEYASKAKPKGKKPVDPDELLAFIEGVDNIRFKAILYVQYYTGNRPSEMVRLQVKHFDLDNLIVEVYMKKQKETNEKLLTKDCVEAVKKYFKTYNMKDDDYFVGRMDRHGNYFSREITTTGYGLIIQRASELAPYVYRKTLIKRLHSRGADLELIRRQTGHANVRTISEHYLNVDISEVGKYL